MIYIPTALPMCRKNVILRLTVLYNSHTQIKKKKTFHNDRERDALLLGKKTARIGNCLAAGGERKGNRSHHEFYFGDWGP